jgi:uncharacterized protein (TIGR02466 family)
MESPFHVEQAFWTPIIVAQDPIGGDDRAALERAILDRRSGHEGAPRSNVGGWQSDKRLVEWGGEAMERLAAEIRAIADANTGDVRTGGAPPEWRLESWATVAEADSYILPHAHGGCYWSAVYYLRADEGEGGELLLHDPRLPALEMHAPNLRFRESGGERAIKTRPKPGMLILFPGWLIHSVSPWKGGGLRISIVVNLAAPSAPKGA